jgi:hypothetical protein
LAEVLQREGRLVNYKLRAAFCGWSLWLVLAVVASANDLPPTLVLLDERFDSYVDQASFEAVWQPNNPMVAMPGPPPYGLLIPENSFNVPPPNDFPPDLQGNAVYIQNALNIYAGAAQPQLEFLTPTPIHAIKLTADMFDDGLPNKRTTVGLRSTHGAPPLNIIELGRYNAGAQDPTDPAVPPMTLPSTGFAYRIIGFGPFSPPLERQPNFQYFPLDPVLDGPDADALVGPNDVGSGWHRYSAVIGLDFVTVALDLFRDGVNNATNQPGVDSTVTWAIGPRTAPFNRLQIGAPSGITGIRGSLVDNIRLELVEIIPEPSAAALLTLGMIPVCRRRV